MTSGQHIDYDALALEALRGVVRACLAQVSRTGLVGDHHFYIAFNTQAPGVGLSKRLKEKYPVEMTIVLQHRFWDLAVDEERFEVKLTFDGIPERLVVPFAAVKVFYDPSVPYVLQFEEVDVGAHGDATRRGTRRPPSQPRQTGANASSSAPAPGESSRDGATQPTGADAETPADRIDRRRPVRRNRPEREPGPIAVDAKAGGETEPTSDATRSAQPEAPTPAPEKPAAPLAVSPPGGKPAIVAVGKGEDEAAQADNGDSASDAGGAKIFDLSKFRGKK